MSFEVLTTKLAARVAFGEKVRLYFSKERRNNHEGCYRRAKINKSAVSCLCMFRVASGERGRERQEQLDLFKFHKGLAIKNYVGMYW